MFDSSAINILDSSTFDHVGDPSVIHGGAIHVSNSNMTVSNSTFKYCQARQGGCIALL